MKKKIERAASASREASDPIMFYTILYQYEHNIAVEVSAAKNISRAEATLERHQLQLYKNVYIQ